MGWGRTAWLPACGPTCPSLVGFGAAFGTADANEALPASPGSDATATP